MRRSILCALVGLFCSASIAQAQIPAFSGAEGPGATASGGRGGDVYHVTNLEFDANGTIPGSLRYGVNTAPSSGRTIVFDVGGTIFQNGGGGNAWFRSSKSNITVAGQTAPGVGVTIAGVGTKWTGSNVILRNLSVRPNKDPLNPTSYTYDGFSLQLKNSIVDHVSTSWYTDEAISLTDAGDQSTVQYATMGEGLTYDGHAFGSIIATEVDGTHYSYNHNLYAHNISRMPAIGSENLPNGATLSFTNNVIYNWQQTKAGYSAGGQHSNSNFLGNFYISGANKGNLTFTGADDGNAAWAGFTKIFLDKTDPVTANVGDMNRDGDLLDGVAFTKGDSIPGTGNRFYSGDFTVPATAFAVNGAVTPDTAHVALERVLAYGGANWANRNPIEQRIVGSVSTGTGALIPDVTGATQAAEWATVMAQRPTAGVAPFARDANWDSDGDGMPGNWEERHGLDPNLASNNGDFDSDGYTNLEEYINELSDWPAPKPIVFEGESNSRYAQIQNWRVQTQAVTSPGAQNAFNDFYWQPSKFDTAVINSGTVAVDAVGQHAGNLVLGMNAGDNATLNITAGWIKVEDAAHGLSDGITSIGDNPAATATLNLSGGKLTTKTLLKGAGGSFNFTGGVLSAETVGFDLVNNGGTIAPGNSPGVTHVMGDLTLSSGVLEIEALGTAVGEYDQLIIDGLTTLGGTLKLSNLSHEYVPMLGDEFDLVASQEGFAGEFANFDLPTLASGLEWEVSAGAMVLSLAVVEASAGLAGDYNSDGTVDAADYTVWQDNFGGTALLNETESLGIVDEADYEAWKANFGTSAAGAGGVNVVPEPTTLALLAIGCVAVGCRRRRLASQH